MALLCALITITGALLPLTSAHADDYATASAIGHIEARPIPDRDTPVGSCVDYTIPSQHGAIMMPRGAVFTLPTDFGKCGLQELHRYCVQRINDYRMGAIKSADGTLSGDVVAGLHPLAEVCGQEVVMLRA